MTVEEHITIAEFLKRYGHLVASIQDSHTLWQHHIHLVAHDVSHLFRCTYVVNFKSDRFRHTCDHTNQASVVGQTFVHQLHARTFKNSSIQNAVNEQALT